MYRHVSLVRLPLAPHVNRISTQCRCPLHPACLPLPPLVPSPAPLPPGMDPSPPPAMSTCLGDLYSVAWMENADDCDLTHETLMVGARGGRGARHVVGWARGS